MRCKKCRYRGADSVDNRQYGNGCDYMSMTHKSRLAQVYKQLGVWRLTPEVQSLLKPENCPFFEKGSRGRSLALDMLTRRPPESAALFPTQPDPEKPPKKRSRRKLDVELARQLHRSGMLDREIGAALGVTANAINCWRRREGLPSNAPPVKRLPGDRIRALHAQGLNDREIGAALGIKPVAVCKWRHSHGLPSNFDAHGKRRKPEAPP